MRIQAVQRTIVAALASLDGDDFSSNVSVSSYQIIQDRTYLGIIATCCYFCCRIVRVDGTHVAKFHERVGAS